MNSSEPWTWMFLFANILSFYLYTNLFSIPKKMVDGSFTFTFFAYTKFTIPFLITISLAEDLNAEMLLTYTYSSSEDNQRVDFVVPTCDHHY